MYVDCQPLDMRVQLGNALNLVGFMAAYPDEVVFDEQGVVTVSMSFAGDVYVEETGST
jgi:hypothetical protein